MYDIDMMRKIKFIHFPRKNIAIMNRQDKNKYRGFDQNINIAYTYIILFIIFN